MSFDGVNGDTTTLHVPVDGTATTSMAITVAATVAPQQFTLWLRPNPDLTGTHAIAFTLTVVAQAGNIVPLVDLFRAAGAIDIDTLATTLKSALNAAQAAANAGDVQTATQQLVGFLIVVETQRGKHIATSATIGGVPVNPVTLLLDDGRNALTGVQVNSPQNPIVGFITSAADKALSGAAVTIFDPANQPIASATSSVNGLYLITPTTGLTPGVAYTAKVTAFPPIFNTATPASQTFTWQSTGVSLAPFVVQAVVPKP